MIKIDFPISNPMKTFCSTTLIVVSLFVCSNASQAQITEAKLNQVELFKQWIGNWKAEIDKDSTFIMECKSFYNGYEFYLKIETKGKIIFEQKTLMGYDKTRDKFIEVAINNSNSDIDFMACWFTSAKRCEEFFLKDIPNPEKATEKWVFEFKSPDLLIWTEIGNSKTTGTYTFHRE